MQAYCSKFKQELPYVCTATGERNDLFLRSWLPNSPATGDSHCKILEDQITDYSPNSAHLDYRLLRMALQAVEWDLPSKLHAIRPISRLQKSVKKLTTQQKSKSLQ